MPKGFSEREKEIIRQKLLEKGREFLAQYGIRRTNVEDLARAAGISKGAFYIFYPSKEELFFDVLEQYEAQMREQLFSYVMQPDAPAQEKFKATLKQAFAFWEGSAFLKSFDQEDMELLIRKLPAEKVQAHLQHDDSFVEQMMERWTADGMQFRRSPKEVSGMMKALFFVSLHRDDFGADSYPETMDLLMDMMARYLVEP